MRNSGVRLRAAGSSSSSSSATTGGKKGSTGTFDRATAEKDLDVEKHFGSVMAHVRVAPSAASLSSSSRDSGGDLSHAAQSLLQERRAKEAVTTTDFDGMHRRYIASGAAAGQDAASSRGLFAHGGIDIRPSRQEQKRQRGSGGAGGSWMDVEGREGGGSGAPEGAVDRDVLQLDAATAGKHGVAVSTASRRAVAALGHVAPHADITLDDAVTGLESAPEAAQKASAVADMLRERLMDLKAEKIASTHTKTHLPRRLAGLMGDAELLQRRRRLQDNARRPSSSAASQRRAAAAEVEGMPRREGGADRKRRADVDVLTLDESKVMALENLLAFNRSSSNTNNVKNRTPADRDSVEARVAGDTESRRSAARMLLSEDLLPGGGPSAAQAALDPATRHIHEGSGAYPSKHPADAADRVFLLRALQRGGLVTRRRAIELITQGRVRVDGAVVSDPFRVITPAESIFLQGSSARLRFPPARLWLYHKPANVVVAAKDPIGRELFRKHTAILGMEHLIPCGHLPVKAHGLMLLTNDGELAEFINSPRTGLQQTFHLRVRPAIDAMLAQRINERGITINGIRHDNITLTVNPVASSRFSVKVQIHGNATGGEQQRAAMPVSHVMQHLGRTIERGGRHSLGPFALSGLAVGSIREVQLPKLFASRVAKCWDPFIAKDMPFFRKLRVLQLRRLSKFRELKACEVEELNANSYDELRAALSFDARELSREAAEMNDRLRHRPVVEEPDLPTSEMTAAAAARAMRREREPSYGGNEAPEQPGMMGSDAEDDDGILLDPVALAGDDQGGEFVRDISRFQ